MAAVAVKKIGEILGELTAGDWQSKTRQAALMAHLQSAVSRAVAANDMDEVGCRALALGDDGELRLQVTNAANAARLRQQQKSLLRQLQKDFPAVKRLRIQLQPR